LLKVKAIPMDEQSFLQILRADPDNDEVRSAFWNWLEATDNDRAPYVRLMRQRSRLLADLEETDRLLRDHPLHIDGAWLDVAFPQRVRSPTIGRCYTMPSPDAAPFVEVGNQVLPGTVVCLIEAHHIFCEITAGCRGVIAEILVANAEPVEYNQTLFRVNRPSLDDW